MKHSIMKFISILTLGSAVGLAGCQPDDGVPISSPTIEIGQCGFGSQADRDFCTMRGAGLGYDFSQDQYAVLAANLLDFGDFSMQLNGSTVVFPASGTFTLNLRNSNGQTVGASSFAWSKQGNQLVASAPTSIQNWLGSTGVTFRHLEVELAPTQIEVEVGVNAVMLTAQMGSIILGASGTIWTQSDCPDTMGSFVQQLCAF